MGRGKALGLCTGWFTQTKAPVHQTTADKAHCSWWMVYFKQCILDHTGLSTEQILIK